MKKVMYYATALSVILLYTLTVAGCDNDDIVNKDEDNDTTIVEGPSSADALDIPTDASFLGDSIQLTRSFLLSDHAVTKVVASTTQNGHISVLGGYKAQSAIYVYAKLDDDKDNLAKEQIKLILEKYYTVDTHVSNGEIVAKVDKRGNVKHESDYRNLRISIKIFAPQNVSTALEIDRGSIIANNVRGNQHTASSTSGAIKYIDSYGGNITVTSEAGYIGLINTSASHTINAKLTKGNILFALPKDTKADLQLESVTKVNAYILNNHNFSGTNTRTKVAGVLNGGGYEIKANSGLGVINLKWYEENEY